MGSWLVQFEGLAIVLDPFIHFREEILSIVWICATYYSNIRFLKNYLCGKMHNRFNA